MLEKLHIIFPVQVAIFFVMECHEKFVLLNMFDMTFRRCSRSPGLDLAFPDMFRIANMTRMTPDWLDAMCHALRCKQKTQCHAWHVHVAICTFWECSCVLVECSLTLLVDRIIFLFDPSCWYVPGMPQHDNCLNPSDMLARD